MWPFSRNKKSEPKPSIQSGEVLVTWNTNFHWWEFSDRNYDYSLSDNPVFDTAVFSQLEKIKPLLQDLDAEIDIEIKRHLEGWCEWKRKKQVVGIDVSSLIEKNEMDVSYADDDWGDLVINIVIRDGKITDSYAGD